MGILPYTRKHQQFREGLRNFCHKEVIPYIDQWERNGIVPKEVWKKMGRGGFLVTPKCGGEVQLTTM